MFLIDLIKYMAGRRKVTRKGAVVWYNRLPSHPGYTDYDYTAAINKAFQAISAKPKVFKGHARVEFSEFFSSGRTGIGRRVIRYKITK